MTKKRIKREAGGILLATANGAVEVQTRFQAELMSLVRNLERFAGDYGVPTQEIIGAVAGLVTVRKSVRGHHYWQVFAKKAKRGKKR